jgi:opacity protein-like surface antigen
MLKPMLKKIALAIAAALVLSILAAAPAVAQTPLAPTSQFGGCFSAGKICAGPSAAITIAAFNLKTSEFSGGVSPGIGYGLTYEPDQWYASGVDLYASLRLGQGQPNAATFSLMGHFANYIFVGVGPSITQGATGQSAIVQWSILGGFGVPIGGTAAYVKAAASHTALSPTS